MSTERQSSGVRIVTSVDSICMTLPLYGGFSLYHFSLLFENFIFKGQGKKQSKQKKHKEKMEKIKIKEKRTI